MFKKSLMAAAVAATLGLGAVGAARADVIAQSILDVQGFIITPSNPAVISPTTVAGSNQATVSLTFDGVTYTPTYTPAAGVVGFTGAGVAPVSGQVNTPGSTYTPFTPLTPLGSPVASSFGNATADLTGGALGGGANAKTDATLSILGNGSGSASSTLGVTATFTIVLGQASSFQFDFNAFPFLRSFVDPLFSAQSGLAFNIDISQGATEFFDWSPDGNVGGITGGTEVFDACSLNSSSGQTLAGENSYTDDCSTNLPGSGGAANQFRAITNVLQAGTYQFKISHFSNASALSATAVPEPSSLLLAGLALVGVGFAGRRKAGR